MTTVDRWQLPDGVEEVLPRQARIVERLRRELLDLYQQWGYQLVIPPLMEFTESLLIGLGRDLDLLTFKMTDQLSGRTLGIRADITPQVKPASRASAMQGLPCIPAPNPCSLRVPPFSWEPSSTATTAWRATWRLSASCLPP